MNFVFKVKHKVQKKLQEKVLFPFINNYNDYNLEGEIWKPVVGYINYEVSNLGRIRKVVKGKNDRFKHLGNIISTRIVNGYEVVSISNYGKQYHCKVHRLVAEAFINNINGYHYINHKDENKLNNKADNLEWCTVLYNNIYNNRAKNVGEKERRYVNIYIIENDEEKFLARVKITDVKKFNLGLTTVYRYINTNKAFYSISNRKYYKVKSDDNTKSI